MFINNLTTLLLLIGGMSGERTTGIRRTTQVADERVGAGAGAGAGRVYDDDDYYIGAPDGSKPKYPM